MPLPVPATLKSMVFDCCCCCSCCSCAAAAAAAAAAPPAWAAAGGGAACAPPGPAGVAACPPACRGPPAGAPAARRQQRPWGKRRGGLAWAVAVEGQPACAGGKKRAVAVVPFRWALARVKGKCAHVRGAAWECWCVWCCCAQFLHLRSAVSAEHALRASPTCRTDLRVVETPATPAAAWAGTPGPPFIQRAVLHGSAAGPPPRPRSGPAQQQQLGPIGPAGTSGALQPGGAFVNLTCGKVVGVGWDVVVPFRTPQPAACRCPARQEGGEANSQ